MELIKNWFTSLFPEGLPQTVPPESQPGFTGHGMCFVETDRGKFHYTEYGSLGPVVYLLHGLTAKNEDWGGTLDILAKTGFHVYAFDMRGHGLSVDSKGSTNLPQANPEFGFSPEGHAADIEACAKSLGHSRVHVVGHSTGGRNALVFAALFPQRAWTLTIVDQTMTADPDSWKKYQQRYKQFPTPFKTEKALNKFLEKYFKKDLKRQVYYKGQFRRNQAGLWDWNYSTLAAWETQRLGREKEAYDWFGKVECPILFIKGGDSVYVPPEEAEKIKGLMKNGRLEVVPRAEHAVFRDNPEGFLKVLVPFLLKQSQGGLFMPEAGEEPPPSLQGPEAQDQSIK